MANGHILIADDENRIRSSLAGILRDEGYDVSMAEDGLQALAHGGRGDVPVVQ